MNDAIIYCQKCKTKTHHSYDKSISEHTNIATFVCGICENRKKLHIIAEEVSENETVEKIKDFFR